MSFLATLQGAQAAKVKVRLWLTSGVQVGGTGGVTITTVQTDNVVVLDAGKTVTIRLARIDAMVVV